MQDLLTDSTVSCDPDCLLVFFCAARKTLPGVAGLLKCPFSRAWVLPLQRAQEEHQAGS